MQQHIEALKKNFLGHAPTWYKVTIFWFLLINPVLLFTVGPFVTGWVLILEFIFTLAMALKCYPLQSGGLIALEAVLIGMTTPRAVYLETLTNFQVILLLIFMVAGIYFMKDLLMVIFTRILLGIHNKRVLALVFCLVAALLSAFLDALTVTAVIISVGVGFYSIYHKVASGKHYDHDHNHDDDTQVHDLHREDLELFRNFLRSLMMHALVGTALGGVCTLVGEPQNLLIAEQAGWSFFEFFMRMSPVTIPVLITGLATCVLVEKLGWLGYGTVMPKLVHEILSDFSKKEEENKNIRHKTILAVQALVGIWLIVALGLHLAEVGIIGLSVIVISTALNGVIDEHAIGKAFEEALPFTALLVVFFVIVAVIHDQHLFQPVLNQVLQLEGNHQIGMFFIANGLLSMISDNVFVSTVYINEAVKALAEQLITRDQFDLIAVAINTGTNIPSIATPNGQAAFLFLLTSTIAPLIRLSYGRMVWMALPYVFTISSVALLATYFWLDSATALFYDWHWITHHTTTAAVAAASS